MQFQIILFVAVSTVANSIQSLCTKCVEQEGFQAWKNLSWGTAQCPQGNPLIGPADFVTSLPNGIQCCATKIGSNRVAECATAECKSNFGGQDHICFNYGSAENPRDNLLDRGEAADNNCPFSKADRAICDVSSYTRINDYNCRNGTGHCLGKVACNTEGVTRSPSDGTARGFGGPCKFASPGFAIGDDCFYISNSESWKVCSPVGPQRKLLVTPTTRKPTTTRPSRAPTTRKPTTDRPTKKPTTSPSSRSPTTRKPTTTRPTKKPTTTRPSHAPTTRKPTKAPTNRPTKKPTRQPTRKPTMKFQLDMGYIGGIYGRPFSYDCKNAYVTDIGGLNNSLFTATIQIRCSDNKYFGGKPIPPKPKKGYSAWGGNCSVPDNEFALDLYNGFDLDIGRRPGYLVHNGINNIYIKGLKTSCENRTSVMHGPGSGNTSSLRCPAGWAISTVYGRKGSWLDRIGIKCSQWRVHPSCNCPATQCDENCVAVVPIGPTSSPTTEQPTPLPPPPTTSPSRSPTTRPTTRTPTTQAPTSPTSAPTQLPTHSPTYSPTTDSPTSSPTYFPTTTSPTHSPTSSPTTSSPTESPTHYPTTNAPTAPTWSDSD